MFRFLTPDRAFRFSLLKKLRNIKSPERNINLEENWSTETAWHDRCNCQDFLECKFVPLIPPNWWYRLRTGHFVSVSRMSWELWSFKTRRCGASKLEQRNRVTFRRIEFVNCSRNFAFAQNQISEHTSELQQFPYCFKTWHSIINWKIAFIRRIANIEIDHNIKQFAFCRIFPMSLSGNATKTLFFRKNICISGHKGSHLSSCTRTELKRLRMRMDFDCLLNYSNEGQTGSSVTKVKRRTGNGRIRSNFQIEDLHPS